MIDAHGLPTTDSPHTPICIFLVEDSAAIRDLIIDDLATIPGISMSGFSETENDALLQLIGHPCDVLIVDIQLKQGNGINVLRTLASDAAHKKTLKVVLSNHTSTTYRRICEQYGVRYFFDKTSEFSQLHLLLGQLSLACH